MRKLFKIADRYAHTSGWKTFALLKLCTLSLGVLIGMHVRDKDKKAVRKFCRSTFVVTYIPLMTKFIHTARHMPKKRKLLDGISQSKKELAQSIPGMILKLHAMK